MNIIKTAGSFVLCVLAILVLTGVAAYAYDWNNDYCYCGRGEVNDLEMGLYGRVDVIQFFDGYSDLRFQRHEHPVYIADRDETVLRWSNPNRPIRFGDCVHVGIRSTTGRARIKWVTWTYEGRPPEDRPPDPPATNVDLYFNPEGTLSYAHIVGDRPISISEIRIAIGQRPVPTDFGTVQPELSILPEPPTVFTYLVHDVNNPQCKPTRMFIANTSIFPLELLNQRNVERAVQAYLNTRFEDLPPCPPGRDCRVEPQPRPDSQLTLQPGWNMISPVGGSISSDSFRSANPCISSGPWWYDPSIRDYVKPPTMEPNKGYWVKATGPCTVYYLSKPVFASLDRAIVAPTQLEKLRMLPQDLPPCPPLPGPGEPPLPLQVDPTSLDFGEVPQGGPNPQSKTFEFRSCQYNWTVEVDQSWVNVQPSNGSSNSLPINITVNVNAASLSPGTHNATITLKAPPANPVTVQVTLTIKGAADKTLQVTPLGPLNFTAEEGGSNPAPQNLQLSSSQPLNWTASVDQPWVQLSSQSGTTPSTLTVSVDISGKTAANSPYNAEITITPTGAPAVKVKVILTITAKGKAMLQVSPPSLSFTPQQTSQDLQLSSSQPGQELDWTATVDKTWVTLSKSSGKTPDTIKVTVDPAKATTDGATIEIKSVNTVKVKVTWGKPPSKLDAACSWTIVSYNGSTATIQFKDLSTGPIVSWSWDFGDGNTCPPSCTALDRMGNKIGSNQNPAHTFNAMWATYPVRLTVADSAGNKDTDGCRVTLSDPAIPVVLDQNANDLLDDAEIQLAISFWQSGVPVPHTNGQVIDDKMMLLLLDIWGKQIPVSSIENKAAIQGRPKELSLRSITLSTSSGKSPVATLAVEGEGVAGVHVRVFSLNGRLLLSEEAQGNRVSFLLVDRSGRPLANGVYLYAVDITDETGKVHRQIKKFAILR